jgi:hypothetical protein
MFVNHLGDAYSDVLRYWMDMTRQLFTEQMTIRIIGQDGAEQFPLIEKDDLMGKYDYKATVLPSIAGQDDVKKKQDMDLFQLLINLPFIDPQKLTGRVINDWGWSLDGIAKPPEDQQPALDPNDPNAMMAAMTGGGAPSGAGPAMPPGGGMPPPAQPGLPPMGAPSDGAGGPGYGMIPRSSLRSAAALLRRQGENSPRALSSYTQANSPINLLQSPGVPPTVRGVMPPSKAQAQTLPNISGHNQQPGSKVNTDIPLGKNASTHSGILNRTFSIQTKK